MRLNRQKLFILTVLTLICTGFLPHANASAQSIIRDTEIENILAEWFEPIFKANGMQSSQVKIILVQDNNINAFVAGGSNIFLYTGLIERTENPGELIGVMAHELGHISGGHLVRGRQALEQASYEAILGTIIGVGAAVAAGDAGGVAAGSTAGGTIATRRFLSKTRTFESSADQAAVRSMEKAGLNPEGLLTFMQKLEGEELLPTSQQSEYTRSHPLTRDRVNAIESKVDASSINNKNYPAEWIENHARLKAKLIGFINPSQVNWQYDDTDTSVAARYAHTIAAYRQNDVDKAINGINALIAREPNNPYFHELKGQMLVDFGRVDQAIAPYKKSLTMAKNAGLIRIALGHALLQADAKANAQEAITLLKRAVQDEPRSSRAHRLLATAYGTIGQDAKARLHLAEEALLQRKRDYAVRQAKSALNDLPKGSADAIRANDILVFIEQNKK